MVALAEPPRMIEVPRCQYPPWQARLIAILGLPILVGAVGLAVVRCSAMAWWGMVSDPRRAVELKRGRKLSLLIGGELSTLRRRIVHLAAGCAPLPCDRELVTLMANKVLIDMDAKE
jgi:hypothetical protein